MKKLPKGFTLIELLLLIGLIAVITTILWATINPIDRMRSGNDSVVQTHIESLSSAELAFSTLNNGFFTNRDTSQQDLKNFGEIKSTYSPPNSDYINYSFVVPGDCLISGSSQCISIVICSQLKSKKYESSIPGAHKVFMFSSVSGKICVYDNGADECNNLTSTQTCP